jgi:hydroxymethylglutaryl-CoA lyase
VRIVDALVRAGFRSIEVTSFGRPEMVPNLADAEDLFRRLERKPGVEYRALVPNLRGALRALDAGADALVVLVTVAEAYARRNQNRSVEEIVVEAETILELGRETGTWVEIGLAMPFFDPYGGDTLPEDVERVVRRLADAGAGALYLATSTGVETPVEVRDLVIRLRGSRPELDLGLHLHDTNGMALVTVLLALQEGVDRFETSLCGLGGGIALPAGAPEVGNLASEDLVHFLDAIGVDTALDPTTVTDCAVEVASILGIAPRSHAATGGTKDALRRLAATGG